MLTTPPLSISKVTTFPGASPVENLEPVKSVKLTLSFEPSIRYSTLFKTKQSKKIGGINNE